MSYLFRTGLAALLVCGAIVACGPDGESYGYGGDHQISTEGDAGSFIAGDGAPSATPMLAKIDPERTLTQTPGEGVGVFAEYDSTSTADPGGHWYIWWTCDTNRSGESCPFDIQISVAHGEISKAKSEGFGADDTLTAGMADGGASSSLLTAATTTTTSVQGVHFDTEPGATITLSASLSGEYSGSFLFFVQDGQPNGDYKGTLTDPLQLQSTTP
jgi:hypothetical protein